MVAAFVALLEDGAKRDSGFHEVQHVYETTVGEVAETIRSFPGSRDTLVSPRVGTGLTRALYSTYLSYLEPEQFS